jgi:hypothetical protein
MHALARLRILGSPHYGKSRKHGNYHGFTGDGGNWKQHWKTAGLTRSDAYRESLKIIDLQRKELMRRQNWKFEQIERLKKERAILARVKSRSGDNGEATQQTGSTTAQEILTNS